jgi:hypothetical protein
MLTIKERILQPLTAIYVATGIAAFTVTLGSLLLIRPDFTPSQSATISSTNRDTLPVVRTTSSTELQLQSSAEDTTSTEKPAESETQSWQKPVTTPAATRTVAPQQSTATPQPTASPVQESIAPVAPVSDPVVSTDTPEVTPADEPSTPTAEEDEPSLLDGLLGVVDAIL